MQLDLLRQIRVDLTGADLADKAAGTHLTGLGFYKQGFLLNPNVPAKLVGLGVQSGTAAQLPATDRHVAVIGLEL